MLYQNDPKNQKFMYKSVCHKVLIMKYICNQFANVSIIFKNAYRKRATNVAKKLWKKVVEFRFENYVGTRRSFGTIGQLIQNSAK